MPLLSTTGLRSSRNIRVLRKLKSFVGVSFADLGEAVEDP